MRRERELETFRLLISFRSNRWKVGIIIGSIALALCLFLNYSIAAGSILFIMFAGAGIFRFSVPSKYIGYFGGAIIFGSATINVILMQMVMNETLVHMGMIKVLLNIISVLVVTLMVFVISLNVQLTCGIGTLIFLLFAIVNNYVNLFRGGELTVLDLISARTAFNVMGSYSFELTPTIVYATLLGIWVNFCFLACPTITAHGIKARAWTLGSIILAAGIVSLGSSDLQSAQAQYIRGGSELNGCFLNFILSAKETVFIKPNGYDLDTISTFEKEYATTSSEEVQTPTIIVIMDESFADLSVLGSELKTNIAVTPFLDSIHENMIRGYALTSVYGGNTPNSEFEFLTGNSMAFLPKSAIPYQQYISQETASIVSLLKSYNYTCEVTHPFDSTGWMRTKVYPLLQFDRYTFIEDYPQENLIRDFVSDQEMFECIIQKYETRDLKNGFFLFGVTMQNHGGYLYKGDNYEDSVQLEGYSEAYPDVEQYLSVIHETDSALEYLLMYFKAVEEPVIILFYGDHLPGLDIDFYEEVYGGSFETLEEQQMLHTIPFFIWANYDIEEQFIKLTSINYLSLYLMEAAGLPLSAYQQFLCDIQNTIPAINSFGYYSLSNQRFMQLDEAEGDEKRSILKYQQLQYNAMFDTQNQSHVFFGVQ